MQRFSEEPTPFFGIDLESRVAVYTALLGIYILQPEKKQLAKISARRETSLGAKIARTIIDERDEMLSHTSNPSLTDDGELIISHYAEPAYAFLLIEQLKKEGGEINYGDLHENELDKLLNELLKDDVREQLIDSIEEQFLGEGRLFDYLKLSSEPTKFVKIYTSDRINKLSEIGLDDEPELFFTDKAVMRAMKIGSEKFIILHNATREYLRRERV